jgi:hypothetical protein
MRTSIQAAQTTSDNCNTYTKQQDCHVSRQLDSEGERHLATEQLALVLNRAIEQEPAFDRFVTRRTNKHASQERAGLDSQVAEHSLHFEPSLRTLNNNSNQQLQQHSSEPAESNCHAAADCFVTRRRLYAPTQQAQCVSTRRFHKQTQLLTSNTEAALWPGTERCPYAPGGDQKNEAAPLDVTTADCRISMHHLHKQIRSHTDHKEAALRPDTELGLHVPGDAMEANRQCVSSDSSSERRAVEQGHLEASRLECLECNKTFVSTKTFTTHYNKFHLHSRSNKVVNFNNHNLNAISSNANPAFMHNLTEFCFKFKSNLIVSMLNINAISNKFSELIFILNLNLVDILVINETKLSSLNDSAPYEHHQYAHYRRDRGTGSGGGIMLFVNKRLPHHSVKEDLHAEIISLTFEPKQGFPVSLIACYRPPHASNEELFFERIEALVAEMEPNNDTLIVGDLNYNMLNAKDSKLNNFTDAHGFHNTVRKGTRLNPRTLATTLLDVILCYCLNFFITSEVFCCPFSDHFLVVSVFNFNSHKQKAERIHSRKLDPDRLSAIKESLGNILGKLNLNTDALSTDTHWGYLKDVIISCINKHAPLKEIILKPQNKYPWIDKEVNREIRFRNKLYNRARKTKNIDMWADFKKARNRVASLLNLKKLRYFVDFTSNTPITTRKLWSKLNPFLNPNKKQPIAPATIISNASRDSPLEVANIFSNFFTSITKKFSLLDINLCIAYVDEFMSRMYRSRCNQSKFKLSKLTTCEVIKQLKAIEQTSSPGSSGIETRVLIFCASELGPCITNLFNQCIEHATIPDEWKLAHVTPIFKGKGSKSLIDNYRPISVLSPVSKVFETLIASQMKNYLENNNLLSDNQFGFRPRRSCELALNTMIEDWRQALDLKDHLVAVFLDLSKAFDTVDHLLLLKKLSYYDFDVTVISLLTSYLKNRRIKTKVNDTLSKETLEDDRGVPQGSILGPLLFILYLNDVAHLNIKSKLTLFADDATLFAHGANVNETLKCIAEDIRLIEEWLSHNRLILNLTKTCAIHFPFSRNHTELYKSLELLCSSGKVQFVTNTKVLGVIIDSHLNFTSHIKSICTKVNYKSFLLKNSLHCFAPKLRPTLFKVFIQSSFDYCSTLFLHSTKLDKAKLEKSFNKALTRLINVKLEGLSLDQQLVTLAKFNLMPLVYRQFYHFSSLLYKLFISKRSSLYKNFELSDCRTRSFFKLPTFYTNYKKFSFSVIGVKLLNKFLYQFIIEKDNNISKCSLKDTVIYQLENFMSVFNSFIT